MPYTPVFICQHHIDRWKLGIDSHDCEMSHIDGLFVKWHITQAWQGIPIPHLISVEV
jgi:hypothetical protein